jgi:beta-lactamase class A
MQVRQFGFWELRFRRYYVLPLRTAMKRLLCISAVLLLGVTLCSETSRGVEQQDRARSQEIVDLQQQLQKLAAPAKGRVGAAAMLLETGDTVDLHGSKHFPMQSVYKLPIVMAVLSRIDSGQLTLDQEVRISPTDLVPPNIHSPIRDRNPNGNFEMTVRELAHAAIVQSDGTASDVLLRMVKPRQVRKFLHNIGVKGIKVENTEKEMAVDNKVQYENWATPLGAVTLLQKLQAGEGLSFSSRDLLLSWMIEARSGSQRIRALLPRDVRVADKTGTSGTERGIASATNDIGLIQLPGGKHLAVSVFVSDSPADENVREAVIAQIARAAWDWATRTTSALIH